VIKSSSLLVVLFKAGVKVAGLFKLNADLFMLGISSSDC